MRVNLIPLDVGFNPPTGPLTRKPRFYFGVLGGSVEASCALGNSGETSWALGDSGEASGVRSITGFDVTGHALAVTPGGGGEAPSHRCFIRYSQKPS